MSDLALTLSKRQRECLRLVWEKQATSKEIAIELGISKSTVDGYIAEAVEHLGARDRRHAAALAFTDAPRAVSGDDPARVAEPAPEQPSVTPSMVDRTLPLPWRSGQRLANALTLSQTIMWVAIIAIGSLAALALATSIGAGLPSVAVPAIRLIHRLTH